MIRDTYHDGVSRPKVRKVRARRPGSWPIAEGDGGAAARRRRPVHRVLGGDRRRHCPHDPLPVLIDRRILHALRRGTPCR